MKTLNYLLIFAAAFTLSCKDKDDPAPPGPQAPPENTVEGKVGGQAFKMQAGRAEEKYLDATQYSFLLVIGTTTNICTSPPMGDKILFNLPKQTGTFDISTGDYTTTIYDASENWNYSVINGEIKITSIDSISSKQIKGEIDITRDSDNAVKGKFTVKLCD